MVNIDRLKASGLSQDKLKSYFSDPKPDSPVKKLINECCDEIRDGVTRNLRDYRIYWAIDRAFDTPFYQLAYTKLRGLLTRDNGGEKDFDRRVMEQVRDWGLVHLLPNAVDSKGCVTCDKDGRPNKTLSLPILMDVEIPLVLAYLSIRWAKLFNDRNLVPLYKYEPIKFNKKNRMRADIITEVMQIMSNQYGYADDECQCILQTLMYGIALKFPREAWHSEKQEDEKGKAKIVKEGLRFNIPHPTRCYYDLYSRLSTINSDSGIKYTGYWELCRYKDIQNSDKFWNKDKVTFGAVGWFNGFSDFFSTVYPCQMKFPSVDSSRSASNTGPLDRESEASYYGASETNNATLLTQHFKKIIPKQYGLGTYEYPVWLRLVISNGETVHWVEPTGFTPTAYYGYDADQNRARASSLALEVIPYQDLSSNVFTQWIHSTRQNLINPVFVNEDVVPREIINQLENVGEKVIRGRVFIPFSDTENIRTSVSVKEAFVAPQLTKHDTAQLANLIRGILDILDRQLVLSSQEIAQSAAHEQTAEEIRTIANTTSTRLSFTGSFIDRGIYATKKMLYDAWMCHGDDNVVAQISTDYADDEVQFKKLLKDIGMEIDDKDDDGESPQNTKRSVKGSKTGLAMEIFASSRDADNRIDSPGIAAAMSQIFTAVAGNEMLVQKIGPDQLVSLLNQIIVTAGLPKEFQLKALPNDGQAPQAMQEQMIAFSQQVKQAIDKSAQDTAKVVLDQTGQALQSITEALTQIAEKDKQQDQQIVAIVQTLQQFKQVIAAAAQPPPEPAYDPNAEALALGT